jgi:HAD superfamily hydrolase (TIGR01509 family)
MLEGGFSGVAMQRIECVVFDIGNVLLRWDPRRLYRRMGLADAETNAIFAETGLLEINHRILDAGGDFASTLGALADRFPRHGAFIRAFDTRWLECLGGAIDVNVAIFNSLKRAGMPVHAISNYNRQKFEAARELFPFIDTFDELVLSGDIGMVKPDAEIFEYLIQRRDLNVVRTVFIDDVQDNVAAAGGLGFATVHFTEGSTDLRHELSALGVPAWMLG